MSASATERRNKAKNRASAAPATRARKPASGQVRVATSKKLPKTETPSTTTASMAQKRRRRSQLSGLDTHRTNARPTEAVTQVAIVDTWAALMPNG